MHSKINMQVDLETSLTNLSDISSFETHFFNEFTTLFTHSSSLNSTEPKNTGRTYEGTCYKTLKRLLSVGIAAHDTRFLGIQELDREVEELIESMYIVFYKSFLKDIKVNHSTKQNTLKYIFHFSQYVFYQHFYTSTLHDFRKRSGLNINTYAFRQKSDALKKNKNALGVNTDNCFTKKHGKKQEQDHFEVPSEGDLNSMQSHYKREIERRIESSNMLNQNNAGIRFEASVWRGIQNTSGYIPENNLKASSSNNIDNVISRISQGFYDKLLTLIPLADKHKKVIKQKLASYIINVFQIIFHEHFYEKLGKKVYFEWSGLTATGYSGLQRREKNLTSIKDYLLKNGYLTMASGKIEDDTKSTTHQIQTSISNLLT